MTRFWANGRVRARARRHRVRLPKQVRWLREDRLVRRFLREDELSRHGHLILDRDPVRVEAHGRDGAGGQVPGELRVRRPAVGNRLQAAADGQFAEDGVREPRLEADNRRVVDKLLHVDGLHRRGKRTRPGTYESIPAAGEIEKSEKRKRDEEEDFFEWKRERGAARAARQDATLPATIRSKSLLRNLRYHLTTMFSRRSCTQIVLTRCLPSSHFAMTGFVSATATASFSFAPL